jgi:K+-transporting ATPase KdpF subunit
VNGDYLIGIIVTVLLGVYLIYVLIRPGRL